MALLLACLPSPSSSPSPPLSESPTPTWPSVKSSLSPTPSQCRQSAARAGSGRSRRRNTDELPSAGSSGEAVRLSSIPCALPVLLGVGLSQSGAHHTPSNAPNTLRLGNFGLDFVLHAAGAMQGTGSWILDAAGGMITTRDDREFELSISRGVIYRGVIHCEKSILDKKALAMPVFGSVSSR